MAGALPNEGMAEPGTGYGTLPPNSRGGPPTRPRSVHMARAHRWQVFGLAGIGA